MRRMRRRMRRIRQVRRVRRVRRVRQVAVLAASVVVVACSDDESTSGETLSPTSTTSTTLDVTTSVPGAGPASGAATGPTTADAATTTSSSTTSTLSATTAPPATTVPPAPTGDVAVALIGGSDVPFWLPLGYWDGNAWVEPGADGRSAPLEFPAASGDPIRVVGLDVPPAASTLGEAGEACFDGRTGFGVDVPAPAPDPPGFGYSAVGVVGDWDIQPRPVEQVGLQVDEYRQIGATFADDLGVDGTAGAVEQVVRSDLDGDGMGEVVVTFERSTDPVVGARGDFSIVYLRVPRIDGSVDDIVVHSSFVPPDLPEDDFPFINRARVLGVADLNGDGRMEVVVRTWYYEGAGVNVFELGDGAVSEVMSNGCGA